ncbi:TnsA endonuclease N-terminal domain-containing protein [Falsirhodobacter xinxiangensis]|uniref:TnsA endonuclease N-terminal domain-containing protein n=1 Tax=Falsirhodobacter xinxiangensis TaxID=2530049 RepID=UPI0010AA5277|nr:TnsA endonuclease N-terminal domain-containing protein [Rhodobacter xinxiangensis]
MHDEVPYQPPRRSRATRSFAARSKSSARGFLFAHLPAQERPRQIIYESNLERRVLLTFLARPDLADIWDQPPAIQYVSGTGALRQHTPDFLATLRTGVRLAIAVKPLPSVERLRFKEELSFVRIGMSPAYADDLLLVTDADLNDAAVRNAELLHIARQTVDADARQAISEMLAGLAAAKTVADILAESGLAHRGWAALICAIHEGEAGIDPGRRIGSQTLLYPRGGK